MRCRTATKAGGRQLQPLVGQRVLRKERTTRKPRVRTHVIEIVADREPKDRREQYRSYSPKDQLSDELTEEVGTALVASALQSCRRAREDKAPPGERDAGSDKRNREYHGRQE